MNNKHYFVPDYMLKFKCLMCGECCKGWKIKLDADTVKYYTELGKTDPEFEEILKTGMAIDPDNKIGTIVLKDMPTTPNSTQKENQIPSNLYDNVETPIKLDDVYDISNVGAKVCPFYDSDGLCIIQKKYGIEALSDICKEHPRTLYETERGIEIFLSFSCKGAAELLKKKEPMQFLNDPEGYSFVGLHNYSSITKLDLQLGRVGKLKYFDHETDFIKILQLRELNFDSRVILLGMAVNKIKDGDKDAASKYLSSIDPRLINEIKSIKGRPDLLVWAIKKVIEDRLLLEVCNRTFSLLFGDGSAEGVKKFMEAYNKYYRPNMEKVSHILENFFASFVFGKKFYNYKSLEAYLMLVFYYSAIRFFAVSKSIVLEKELDEDLLISVINRLDRRIEHNKAYKESILKLAADGDLNKIKRIHLLLNI